MQPGKSGYLAQYGVTVHRVKDFDSAGEFMRWLGERRSRLGVDTETTGLRPDFDRIRYIQFGDLKTGWAIPWEDWRGLAKQALTRYEGDMVLHNSKFDVRMIEANSDVKMPWHRIDDTMNMAHLVDTARSKGLKPLAAMLVDPQAVASQKLLNDAVTEHKWDWASIPMDYQWYWVYAAMDPVLTCHVYEHLAPLVKASYAKPYDLEMGTTRVISKMEANGARVDLDYVRMKRRELSNFVADGKLWAQEQLGIANIGSSDQLIAYFKREGVELPPVFTDSGKQAMDKDVLAIIDHPLAQHVLNVRKADKLATTYFKNLEDLRDADDRVHANIWTMGTKTARMSVTDPALQTLPKRDTTVRTAFIPSDGMALVSCDYSQIEARLMAHFSGSPGLIAAFLSDDDFFCTVAAGIFGESISKKDARRQLTKNTIYGKLYGAGVPTMAATARVPEPVMRGVVRGFDERYPEVLSMASKITQEGKARSASMGVPYVITPTGRRLTADKGSEYTLVNYLIQSHAAEVFKRAIVNLDTVLPEEVRLILPVHDEVVSEVPIEDADELTHLIESSMADLDRYAVPITAEGEWASTNWGDLVS